jgi:hypothetical protein
MKQKIQFKSSIQYKAVNFLSRPKSVIDDYEASVTENVIFDGENVIFDGEQVVGE